MLWTILIILVIIALAIYILESRAGRSPRPLSRIQAEPTRPHEGRTAYSTTGDPSATR